MWIVIGEDEGMIKLVSKSGTEGILPRGSYLTVEEGDEKFMLRVERVIRMLCTLQTSHRGHGSQVTGG